MSTPPINFNPVTAPQPARVASAPPNDNSLAFDPAYDSTLTFDATKQPPAGFKPSAYPGDDAVTQMLLILDQISKHPENTTDAQLFLLYTSGLVQNGMIYQPLTPPYTTTTSVAPDGSITTLTTPGTPTTLDALIASIEFEKADKTTESLIACAIDVAIEEKYAQEIEAGNLNWDPNDEFFDYLHSLFPPDGTDEKGNPIYNSEVSRQANEQIDNWEGTDANGTDGKWYAYQKENPAATADPETLRANTSAEWNGDVKNSNINTVETQLRVDIVHSASNGGRNFMQSLMMLYGILEMLGMGDLLGLSNQVDWFNDRTNDLNVISGEWSDGFADDDEAYQFLTDVEDYVYETNDAPDGYADQNLIDTVNNSLGTGGFLGTTTNLYYQGSDGNYYQANLDYLAQHPPNPNDTYYSKNYTGSITIAPDPNLPAKMYWSHDSGYSNVYDANGNQLTYGDLIDDQSQLIYNQDKTPMEDGNGHQYQGVTVLANYSSSYQAGYSVDPLATSASIAYYTLEPWQLDPTGTNPLPAQNQPTQQQINTNITANTNTASSTSNEVDQMSNWIQAVQSAMSSAIQAYIEQLNTFIDHQTAY